jgi:hypothetical protein
MAELKTRQNDTDVTDFINSIEDETKKQDCLKLLEVFKECTGESPKMWGTSIVGYGSYHYKSARSKQEGDWFMTGFSPRKANLTIYIIPGFDNYKDALDKLGKHITSVSCLMIARLSDIDIAVLNDIITNAYEAMNKQYK